MTTAFGFNIKCQLIRPCEWFFDYLYFIIIIITFLRSRVSETLLGNWMPCPDLLESHIDWDCHQVSLSSSSVKNSAGCLRLDCLSSQINLGVPEEDLLPDCRIYLKKKLSFRVRVRVNFKKSLYELKRVRLTFRDRFDHMCLICGFFCDARRFQTLGYIDELLHFDQRTAAFLRQVQLPEGC